MSKLATVQRRQKTGGRQPGTPNRVTADIRQALKQLADGNAASVQGWLDRVAATDPAEATRLWLALLRFVTPTLQAAAITELTRPRSVQAQLSALTNDELMTMIMSDPEAMALIGRQPLAPAALIEYRPERDTETCVSLSDDELLR
jgi:hypothetical protein